MTYSIELNTWSKFIQDAKWLFIKDISRISWIDNFNELTNCSDSPFITDYIQSEYGINVTVIVEHTGEIIYNLIVDNEDDYVKLLILIG